MQESQWFALGRRVKALKNEKNVKSRVSPLKLLLLPQKVPLAGSSGPKWCGAIHGVALNLALSLKQPSKTYRNVQRRYR
jgi:hypothetical protein